MSEGEKDHGRTTGAVAGAGILPRTNGASIAYRTVAGRSPGVVFLHGFHSDMNGGKALAVERFCTDNGYAFVRYDAFGHGASSGAVADGTIGGWVEDALAVIDDLTTGPQVLVGSSLGGWIALLAALQRPRRVAGLVGIAAAPDFTETLMWAEFTPAQRRTLLEQGEVWLANEVEPDKPWCIRRSLIEDGRNHQLLVDTINLYCPVRLIHGQRDADVPWETALKIADCLAATDVEVLLVKDGDHRLSRDADIARLTGTLADLLQRTSTMPSASDSRPCSTR
ncbi:MAG: alpha/beta hydrolase [Magnetospirillum sp.]|nr:alpha/beta hydrolase [Magnetospirillum sp.]